ncbi:type II toxin-antitoxin system RelE/ParE family toxin [Rhizobium sp. Leaf306]|jgi:putative addiction module killer protein|nr:type II toxin-antitoxin system RelE/ParE family toxin [Rhizobium sp. Leaf306]
MRIHHGPGYRVYFVRRDRTILLLLCGGDKDSQARDIAEARKLAAFWKG